MKATALRRSATAAATGVWSAAGPTADVTTLLAGVHFVPASGFTASFSIATSVSDGSLAATGTKTITHGVTPTVSIVSVSRDEGNSGTSQMTFTVSLSAATSRAVSVDFATSGGTASAGTDYTAVSTTVTVPAGQTSATVGVAVNGDLQIESDETFNVSLTHPTNATLGQSTATGTIVNDDVGVAVTSPNGGENWAAASTQSITWRFAGTSGKLTIDLYKAGVLVKTIAKNVGLGASGQGSYSWPIPRQHRHGIRLHDPSERAEHRVR